MRAIATLYIVWRYPDDVMAIIKLKSISWLFNADPLVVVRDFMQQLSKKPEADASNAL